MLNLDTHVPLHAVAGRLRPREAKLLRGAPWSISAICSGKVAKLVDGLRSRATVEEPWFHSTSRNAPVFELARPGSAGGYALTGRRASNE
jgi:hypothetical protein